ncbi:MAG: hypothetical protein ACRD6X_04445 [Pyrinomonadaceae bacterium]
MKSDTPLEILIAETEQINPAILLAEEFMRRDATDLLGAEDIARAEAILAVGRLEIEMVKSQIAAFERSAACPSSGLPLGF